VKAVHVLVPQLEHQLRALLLVLGIPTNKQIRRVTGIMQMKSVNDVSQEERVRAVLGENLSRYFDIFLADQRGQNLRNRIAHGLVDAAELTRLWLAEISSAESCIDSFLAQAGTLSL
jgi:Domain of unknown function (DUF4209)